jgi:four helix bundle protein
MQDFKRLRATARARAVIKSTYRFTRSLPRDEQFGLVRQMRRAAISIGLNIAEGCSRNTTREFLRFLEIGRGSGTELEFAILITEDLEMGDSSARLALAEELNHTQRTLTALMKALRRRLADGSRT